MHEMDIKFSDRPAFLFSFLLMISTLIARIVAIIAVLLSSTLLFGDHDETATATDFQELGNKLAGRWMADVVLLANWPGHDRRMQPRTSPLAHA